MKIFLTSFVFMMLTASCGNKSQEAFYNMIHERERQECLKQGRTECPRGESYDKYKQKREDVIN
ncbi:MAG: hypothetical protein OQK75_07020 [Gammaproteobacteria bacterium]|nr:hypothetical protein [Gammaproteobacteria bacterium]MCW8987409.1 hypothetical protein [Gammaproteobacteria bacterium]